MASHKNRLDYHPRELPRYCPFIQLNNHLPGIHNRYILVYELQRAQGVQEVHAKTSRCIPGVFKKICFTYQHISTVPHIFYRCVLIMQYCSESMFFFIFFILQKKQL